MADESGPPMTPTSDPSDTAPLAVVANDAPFQPDQHSRCPAALPGVGGSLRTHGARQDPDSESDPERHDAIRLALLASRRSGPLAIPVAASSSWPRNRQRRSSQSPKIHWVRGIK